MLIGTDKLHIHLSAKAQALKENGHIVIYPLSFHDDVRVLGKLHLPDLGST